MNESTAFQESNWKIFSKYIYPFTEQNKHIVLTQEKQQQKNKDLQIM